MSRPSFSILLPSRNRLELLKHAVDSVLAQNERNLEIIISDNESSENYVEYVRTITSVPVRYIRGDSPISVTDNWNRALKAATGDYIVMLGDDDALTPGFIQRMSDIIEAHSHPDVVYCMAYHYAYPDVLPNEAAGYLCTVNNSSLFDDSRAPYVLNDQRARQLGQQALRFRHLISFNAQHYVWRREFVQRDGSEPAFFQSPYPDFFASFVTFLTAKKIVVTPTAEVIIGISKRSFGFFHANDREEEGFREFFGESVSEASLAAGDDEIIRALRHPGTGHYRNWLIAALFVKQHLADSIDLRVDLRRYRRIQIFELAQSSAYNKTLSRQFFRQKMADFDPRDLQYAERLLWTFAMLDRVKTLPRPMVVYGIRELLNIHHPPKIFHHNIGNHANIADAFRWLEKNADSILQRNAPL
ncbi:MULTISPECIES: glycosyltransferase family 2 protein [unclassified Paraburkholderia]|uniref:glycosyltransferase family 2 protein n=1 Tax=unclassified Paraburkholderia TaxID=2615204 RepID=UPI0016070497|nr:MULTISPECIES: glycosyltransferase family A protein [unclassified Paraburkholderia]